MPTALTPDEHVGFHSRFTESGPDECWNWTGSRSTDGVPQFRPRSGGGRRRPQLCATRVMYELRCGPIPEGRRTYVIPKCGNKRCVNPKHLVLSYSTRLPADGEWPAVPSTTPAAAVSPQVLAALDSVTAADADSIAAEIRACELRLSSLRALLGLASLTSRSASAPQPEPVRAPAPAPAKRAERVAPRKLGPPAHNMPLARRMAYFVASANGTTLDRLVEAMGVSRAAVEYQLKSTWFELKGGEVSVTEAGMAVALEGTP